MVCKQSDAEKISCTIDQPYVNCVEMLGRAIDLQWDRIITLRQKEIELNILMAALSDEIKLYTYLLLALQKLRFDLGLDEFKGPMLAKKANVYSRPRQEKTERPVYAPYADGQNYW